MGPRGHEVEGSLFGLGTEEKVRRIRFRRTFSSDEVLSPRRCVNINSEVSVAESRAQTASSSKPIRAPRGPQISCKGWQQEAALRLLMNSADPAIADYPERLMVSGGVGKLARDWQAFHAITKSLQTIDGDETLVIDDGQPGPILETNVDVPPVLVVNSTPPAANWMFTGPSSALPEAYEALRAAARRHFGGSLAGRLLVAAGMGGGIGGALPLTSTLNGAAFLGIDADVERIKRRVKTGYCEVMVNNLDEALRILKNAVRKREPASVGLIANPAELVPELARRGVLPDLLTDQTYADEPCVPPGLTVAQALELSEKDPRAYVQKGLDSIAAQGRALLELQKMGTFLFGFGNEQEFAPSEAYAGPPAFISEYLTREVAPGRGPLTIVALSGDLGDLARIDELFPSLFPDSDLQRWVAIARKHPSLGLPARSCWIAPDEATKLGTAINDLVARGTIKAPVVMGRSIRQNRSRGPLGNHPASQARGGIGEILRSPQRPQNDKQSSSKAAGALADWPALAQVLNATAGASWLSLVAASPSEGYREQIAAFALVIDGQPKTPDRIARVFAKDFAAHGLLLPPPNQDPR